MRIFFNLRRCLAGGLTFVLLAQTSLAQVTQLPDLGDPAQDYLTPAQEKQIAEEVLFQVHFHEQSYLDDPEIEEYLSALGRRLTSGGVTQNQNYQFFVLRDPTINAFAMPGAVIGVHTALIATTQTESELAAVFSHEMGHVEQHHMARMLARQSNTTAWALASLLLAVVAGRGGSADAAGAALMGGQAALIQRQLAYSRDNEREADRVGLRILYSAGFDPQGMTDFFKRMYQQTQIGENNAIPYLMTHPLTVDRITDIGARVSQLAPHPVTSSDNYMLVRAKVEVLQLGAHTAIARLQERPAKTRLEQLGRWYGLARAYLEDGKFVEAHKALTQLQALKPDSSMVATLAADLASAEKHFEEAARICHGAFEQYPARRSTVYCEAEAWLAAGKAQNALTAVDGPLRTNRQDYRLYMLEAKANTALGHDAQAHRSQAEVYVLQGNRSAAIDQLELAQRDRGGNYIEQASIDARLRELRALDKEDKDKKDRDRDRGGL
jgi:beta-barrel assembly-enhancing protease